MDAWTAGNVEVGGQQARVVQAGAGPDVVVLHGWGGRVESMAPVIECLRPSFRVTALDLPGFGESPVPKGVWGTPDYAAFVRDVLAAMDVTKAHFVAHSYGARTSLYLAATHQEMVDKLVIAGASGLRSAPSLRAQAKRYVSRAARTIGKLGGPGARLRDAVYDRIASKDYRDAGAMRPVLVKIVNEDISPLLPRVRASTLLIWGTSDDAVPLAHARMMEGLIPGAGLALLEGAGHFAYLEEPERFCRIVRHFLGAPLP